MTLKQKILKAVYPLLIWITKLTGKNMNILTNTDQVAPSTPVYDLKVPLNNGQSVPLSDYKGKKVMLVNTASNCGYTGQYNDLQELYEQYKNKLTIIAFPANDFGEQEKGSDQEIAQFCQVNFGVSFPLAKKSVVINSNEQNPVFQWLTNKKLNGWNDQAPTWNFSKYLLNEEGMLTHYFDPSISPLSTDVISAVEKKG
jgi:glutathione peroxidase